MEIYEFVFVRAILGKLASAVQGNGVSLPSGAQFGAPFDPSIPSYSDDPSSGVPSFGSPLYRRALVSRTSIRLIGVVFPVCSV